MPSSVADRLTLLNQAFIPSSPVHTQELLAGRTTQLFELLEVSTTPGACAAIFGERGVGKTSVSAVHAADLMKAGTHIVVRVNCSAVDSFSSLWRSVADDCKADYPLDVVKEVGEAGRVSQQLLLRMLRSLTAGKPGVFLFDEFDILADCGVGEDFANLMKAVSDQGIAAHIVIVGVAESVDTILHGHQSVGRNLHQVFMQRLSNDEIRTILNTGMRLAGLAMEGPVVERVVSLSQGFPHYAHLLGKHLGTQAIRGEREKVVESDWLPALDAALRQGQQAIIELYGLAVTTAKPSMFPDLLLACALAPTDDQGFFRPIDAGHQLERLRNQKYAMASYTGNLASLAHSDRGPALQVRTFADGRKRYRFANPLLRPYVLMKAVRERRIDPSAIEESEG